MPNQLPEPARPSPNSCPEDPRQLPEMRSLTRMQQDFVLAYLGPARGVATEAANLAGYAGDRNQLGQTGHQNLKKPKIKSAMQAVQDSFVMNVPEALAELGKIARATQADFFQISEKGYPIPDLNKAKRRGVLGAVQQIEFTADGLKLKLYDRLKALRLVLQYHETTAVNDATEQLWRDQQEISEAMGINFFQYFDQRRSRD